MCARALHRPRSKELRGSSCRPLDDFRYYHRRYFGLFKEICEFLRCSALLHIHADTSASSDSRRDLVDAHARTSHMQSSRAQSSIRVRRARARPRRRHRLRGRSIVSDQPRSVRRSSSRRRSSRFQMNCSPRRTCTVNSRARTQ